jgi:uncharacterized protein (TIGR01777 family)
VKILVTGGTGFIGTRLCSRLVQEGHTLSIITRAKKVREEVSPGLSFLHGDTAQKGPWQEVVKNHDAVVNLAGASIFSKWTAKQKKLIQESRIQTTRNIVEGMEVSLQKPVTIISASAIGYYGFHGDEELDEESPRGDDFLATVCRDWEAEALKAGEKGARVILTRFGIVLGEEGGTLSQMVPLYKYYIGGSIGSGKQWFSWIHIQDLVEAIVVLMSQPEVSGPLNLCSPNPVRNKDLAKALGKALHRPSFFPAPAFMVRLILGEFGTLILKGQRVLPRRLLDNGFVFQYPDLGKALQSLLVPSQFEA